jgi:hypothetical protein
MLRLFFRWSSIGEFPKDFLYFIGQVIAPVSGISGTDISARLTGSFNNMEFQELIVLI